jgi:hypothetical protein
MFCVVVITHCIFLLYFHIRTNNTSFQYMLVVFASVHQITVKSCALSPVFLLKQVTIIRIWIYFVYIIFVHQICSVCVCCDVFCCLEHPVFAVGLSFVDLEHCEMVHFANTVSSIFCMCYVVRKISWIEACCYIGWNFFYIRSHKSTNYFHGHSIFR